MVDWQWNQASRRLVGAVVCLCFFLQVLVVPLHLAVEEHNISLFSHEVVQVEAQSSHSHSGNHHHHGDHDHGQAPERDESDPDHPLHPAEDHVADLAKPAVAPAPALLATLLLLSAEYWELPMASKDISPCDAHAPPRPPPKRVASPRAPPVVA